MRISPLPRRAILIVLSFIFFVCSAEAQDEPTTAPLTIEQIEQAEKEIEELQKTLELIDALRNTAEAVQRNRYTDCLQSFGHVNFCRCISDKLVLVLDFTDYIAITTSTKEELGHESLSESDKQLVDGALAVREKCVKSIHGN